MRYQNQQGFALVSAIAVAVVLMGVITVMMIGTVGNLQQTRATVKQAQARAVAEAGQTVARNALEGPAKTEIQSTLNTYLTTFVGSSGNPATTWVVPSANWTTVASTLQTNLNANTAYTTMASSAVGGLGSGAMQFSITNFRGQSQGVQVQTYLADYTITSTGTAADGKRTVEEKGTLTVQLGRQSLSQYLFLVDDAAGASGFFTTGNVFNGPAHANHNWGFRGAPQFNDTISTSDSNAWYWTASGCSGSSKLQLAADSRPPCTVPVFAKGFQKSVPAIALPTTVLGQNRAALGLTPTTDINNDGLPDSPTTKEICVALKLASGSVDCNVNPPATPPTGVYLVNNSSSITGGIYVQGDVDQLTVTSVATAKQKYTFVQGITTYVILVDYNANTTTITKTPLGLSTTYTGTPNGPAAISTGGPTGQIFVTGTIKSLTGPARTGTVTTNSPQHPVPTQIPPALSLETQLNITAQNQIGLTGDLTYECDPTVTASSGRCNGSIPNNTVLGVMSTTSDVQIKTTAPSDLYLWGSYLVGTSSSGLSVENATSRPAQGTLHMFGGLIQSTDQIRGQFNGSTLSNGYLETYDYDSRFKNSALTPPNFPTTRYFKVQDPQYTSLSFTER